ncbi:TIGR04063 family PEP-CTERM/XrtA system glycosyltransferase [Hydrogenophaga intermedia]|jgi:glycogen synthase|uniref:TIGR04063 family PEP-CTERM/XrtA system glycosyltransferase n=1 Tax=Hydrogenophaga intermedia TaxID=65786 RepID=UPI00204484AC|nr:TIGR04063 family PEP-CTERM/XrtA system glycosyltransferase [Hydrogenophaga intermedia]MCM3563270.1 glycosyltransferase, exosortase A system-associated [Hydrogenophaga intermedia]
MRILHVLDHSIPLHSGYTFRTVSLLREQRALGWETFHLTSPKQGRTEADLQSVDGLDFFRTPMVPGATDAWPLLGQLRLIAQMTRRLREVADGVRPDVIHAHSPVLNAVPAIRVGRELGIPVVYEIRAFWEDAAVDHGTTREGSLRYRLTRALETWAIRKADHVFTICEGLRADIARRGIDPAKVTVVPNAVDTETFQASQPPDAALKRTHGLEGKVVLGFIGSFYAYEGLDLLIESLPTILESNPAVALLLVGGGPEEGRLREQVARLKLDAHVRFAGRVPHKDVNRYYDLIDVLAYPRHSMRLTELVTPLKPLEAMAQQKLFVASSVGGHRELVEHMKTGVLFEADNKDALARAVLDLLARPDIWPNLKANGRTFVETVRNWKNSVANYKPVFERITRSEARA